MSATAEWTKLLGELTAKGATYAEAKRQADRRRPGLRLAFLAEYNAEHGSADAALALTCAAEEAGYVAQ